MAREQLSQSLICQGRKTESTNGFKDNHSVPARSSTDSESTLCTFASKKVWNKAPNVGAVSNHCSDIFPPSNTHKQYSMNYVCQQTLAYPEAPQSFTRTQWQCLVFKFNHLLTQPEMVLQSVWVSCSSVWPADKFPMADFSRAVWKELLSTAASATKANPDGPTVWPCKVCRGMKGATIMQSAESLRKRDLARSLCWTCRARSASGKAVNHSVLAVSIKSSKLKRENFLPCFCFLFPFYWQITPVYICPRNHAIPLQT